MRALVLIAAVLTSSVPVAAHAADGWSATCQRANGACTAQACGRTPDSARNRCALLCSGEAQTIELRASRQCAANPRSSQSPAAIFPSAVRSSDPVAARVNASLEAGPGRSYAPAR